MKNKKIIIPIALCSFFSWQTSANDLADIAINDQNQENVADINLDNQASDMYYGYHRFADGYCPYWDAYDPDCYQVYRKPVYVDDYYADDYYGVGYPWWKHRKHHYRRGHKYPGWKHRKHYRHRKHLGRHHRRHGGRHHGGHRG